MSRVFVLVEHRQGALRDVTFEMLAAARGFGTEVEAVLLGDRCDSYLPQLQQQAHRVLYGRSAALKEYNYEAYQRALLK
ncbi:electron transfer flavoprotein subunit alpha/FixB family protein, partial [candidate division WOR-3 bacterium]|nr:electron transfer flavoprotein subunit alpha/FixB family protein [candidate division WOR-3 bacterium]